MKEPVRIDRLLMNGSVPEPPEHFQRRMEQLIDELPRKERVIVKKKISTAAIVLFALLLISATALAIGLTIDEIWKQSFEKMNTSGIISTVSYPEEGDMTAEEAIALARSAIQATYGTTDEELDAMGVYPRFFAHGYDEEAPDDPAQWRLYFSSRTDVDIDLDTTYYGPDGEYRVYLNAENKDILFINWYTNDFWSKAQRVWDCGSYDEVYWHYHQPSFYDQSPELQTHFEQLLKNKGYELIEKENKYHELLDANALNLLFHTPSDAIEPGEDAQADAAWAEIEVQFGLDPDLMRAYAYQATRLDLQTGTDDICIAYNYEEEFALIEAGLIDSICSRLFSSVNRLGIFMVSFEPGTTDVAVVTHLLRSEEQRQESVTEGALLEKNDWDADDLAAYDAAYTELEKAVERMHAEKATAQEQTWVLHAVMRALGGDEELYDEKNDDYDVRRWFEGEETVDEDEQLAREAYELYGRKTMFWPLEVQAKVLGDTSMTTPKPGEMTQEEAIQKAIAAIVDLHGQDALDALGEYHVGCQLFRFENQGESTRWHIYVTDDPERMENGWRVVFVDKNSERLGDGCEVKDISDPGNG